MTRAAALNFRTSRMEATTCHNEATLLRLFDWAFDLLSYNRNCQPNGRQVCECVVHGASRTVFYGWRHCSPTRWIWLPDPRGWATFLFFPPCRVLSHARFVASMVRFRSLATAYRRLTLVVSATANLI